MKHTRRTLIVSVAGALLLGCADEHVPKPNPAVVQPAAPVAPAPVAPAPAAPAPAAPAPEPPADVAPAELPKLGTNAQHRLWVRGTIGPRADQFGKVTMEDGTYPPQGFVPTADGRLLVLDTGKKRLLWYGQDGKLERTVALNDPQLLPSDVAVATDGTIAVSYDSGNTVLFDAQGNTKHEFPGAQHAMIYAVGDDFYVDVLGVSSVKQGNAKGSRAAATPGVFQEQDGTIPGHVAPDGTTVVSTDVDKPPGTFFVSVIRGSSGEKVWKRFYRSPGHMGGIPFLQADAAGRIYAVINGWPPAPMRWPTALTLLCIDGKTGNPVGMVSLPWDGRSGGHTVMREYSVAPQGGLVYAKARKSSVSYEWFNCHP